MNEKSIFDTEKSIFEMPEKPQIETLQSQSGSGAVAHQIQISSMPDETSNRGRQTITSVIDEKRNGIISNKWDNFGGIAKFHKWLDAQFELMFNGDEISINEKELAKIPRTQGILAILICSVFGLVLPFLYLTLTSPFKPIVLALIFVIVFLIAKIDLWATFAARHPIADEDEWQSNLTDTWQAITADWFKYSTIAVFIILMSSLFAIVLQLGVLPFENLLKKYDTTYYFFRMFTERSGGVIWGVAYFALSAFLFWDFLDSRRKNFDQVQKAATLISISQSNHKQTPSQLAKFVLKNPEVLGILNDAKTRKWLNQMESQR